MKHIGQPAAPASETAQDSLKNLRDVSHIHDVVTELLGDIRRDAAKKAHSQGATLRQMGEAMGRHHTSVKALIDGTAA